MPYTVTIYTTWYAAWEEGEDEPRKLGTEEDAEEFDDAEEAIEFVARYACEASAYPMPGDIECVWYAQETYIHPYTSEREEKTFHLGPEWTAEMQRTLYARVHPGLAAV